jgi:hypothetical protein
MQAFELLYPITPAFASRLAAVVSKEHVQPGTEISIHGNKYKVLSCSIVKFKFFVAANRLKVFKGYDTIHNRDAMFRFLMSCGFSSVTDAIIHLFRHCKIEDLTATREAYLVSFVHEELIVS